jgi:hypothetical protein
MSPMPGVLVGIPIAGAMMLWLVRARLEREHWAGSVAAALALLVMTLLAQSSLPAEFSISNWGPIGLFHSEISLILDPASWLLVTGSSLLLLSVLLTSVARPGSSDAMTRALSLAYTGLAIAALQAANLLTVILFWALADGLAFVVLLGEADSIDTVWGLSRRFAVQTGSIFLVLAASVPVAPEPAVDGGLRPALLGAAVLLRVGLWPLHVGLPQLPGLRRGMGALVRLLPPVMALAVLGRFMPADAPSWILLVLLVLASASVLVGGLRWFASTDAVRARPYLVLCYAGIAVAVAAGAGAGERSGVADTAFALLIVGGLASQMVLHERWHRWVLAATGAIAAGLPFTAFQGSLVGQFLGPAGGTSAGYPLLVVGVGMALVAAGTLRLVGRGLVPWESGEGFVRNAYGAGVLVLLLGAMLAGLPAPTTQTAGSLVSFALVLAAAISLNLLVGDRLDRALRRSLAAAGSLSHGVDRPAEDFLGASLNLAARLVRGLGSVFEGGAALLWVYVFVLVAALVLVGGGGG